MMDDKGQIAVDFLLGISLFLIALTFTVQFIPGMFMSGSAGESSLDYTAYRTATVLVEDTGWWGNSTSSGTDWEEHPGNVMRIGLAVDDDLSSKLTNSPNIISRKKTLQMMNVDKTTFIEMLGLYNNVDDTLFAYGYNISFTQDGNVLMLNNTSIIRGQIVPEYKETTKITRIVLMEKGTIASFTGDDLTSELVNTATINITGPFVENITIQICDLNFTGLSPMFLNASLDGTTLIQPSNYTVCKIDGWEKSSFNGSLSSPTDVLSFNFDKELFSSSSEYRLDLEFRNVTLPTPGPPFIDYNDWNSTHYEPAYLVVEVWE
ncbi:hypothetical protein SAMN04488589_2622 [Methanolobus vulcani]|jgi:hypothetical protein|uniref:Uncharacterized protein n=1 Tax=Methanolobus vulcani TaxID=38026 RepID=A0A7Z7FF93_9EURY|nr:hypothetical protein [Methanolobus vulcani]SDG29526.1 hypothetical protein SAMN04488589_2622 [Methanolobus vulcani]